MTMTAQAADELPAPWPLARFQPAALFLDLDGTLAAIETRPEDVRPEPWRTALIRHLQQRLEGRLAVISGRSLEDIDRILEGAAVAVGAVHGLVRRRADGSVIRAPPHPNLRWARIALQVAATGRPGLLVEDKGLSVALHYRRAPELAGLAVSEARRAADEHGLKLQLGNMVAEICTPGFDKGTAVRAFMRERPFERGAPLFVGDDLTDEHGFSAAKALGGVGILVGEPRPTAADLRLDDVAAVRAWLEAGGADRRQSGPGSRPGGARR
jgi:trehalose 6-phosphate phosphatase